MYIKEWFLRTIQFVKCIHPYWAIQILITFTVLLFFFIAFPSTAGAHNAGGCEVPPLSGGVVPNQRRLQQAVPSPHPASPHPPRWVQRLEPQLGPRPLFRGSLRHGDRVHPCGQEAEWGRLQGEREPTLPAAHQRNPLRVLCRVLPGIVMC